MLLVGTRRDSLLLPYLEGYLLDLVRTERASSGKAVFTFARAFVKRNPTVDESADTLMSNIL
jgi:hypothetical protein